MAFGYRLYTRKERGVKLSVCGVKQWNVLTDDIKERTNLVIFKQKFKDMTLEKSRRNSIDEAS